MSNLSLQKKSRNIAFVIILIALGSVLAPFTSFQIGLAKVNPTQHFINVIAAVLLGPIYGTSIAGGIGLIRNATGTGTLFAFPGGMIGVLLGGIMYKKSGKEIFAVIGEIIGTGIIAPIVCSLFIAPVFMDRSITIIALLPSFLVSAIIGATLGRIALISLKKANVYS